MTQPSAVVISTSAPSRPVARPDDAVVRADEAGHERRLRSVVQILRRAQLFEASMTHDADVIGQHQRLGLIVGDVDEGRAEGGLQLLQFDLHVLAQLEIERTQRFVEQQQGRLEHQAARDGDALPLAARQLIDAFARRTAQAHALQHGVAAFERARRAPRPRRANPNATFSPTDIIGNSASC